MEYWEIVRMNIVMVIISYASYMVFMAALFGKRCSWKGLLAALIPFGIVNDLFASGLFYLGYFSEGFPVWQIVQEYVSIAQMIVIGHFLYREKWKNSIVAGALAGFLLLGSDEITSIFVLRNLDLTIVSERIWYLCVEYLGTPLLVALIAVYLNKIEIHRIFRFWMEHKERARQTVWAVFLPAGMYTAVHFANQKANLLNSNPVIALSLTMIVYGIVIFTVRTEMQKQRLEEQEAGMIQQQLYVQNLEKIQQEMRIFRHDYKNMMAGMYLQAQEGDLPSLQLLIQKMTTDFDEQVGEEIRMTTQIGNMRIPELKSLLLTKVMDMKKKGIPCGLEIFRPIEKTQMGIADICRVMGIFLDNAVEAAETAEVKHVRVMISSNQGYTTYRIENRAGQPEDLNAVWKSGYSTKGPGRGLGLYSARKLLEKYSDVLTQTSYQDGWFCQEIKIKERG